MAGGRRGRVRRETGRGGELHVLMHAQRPANRRTHRTEPDGPPLPRRRFRRIQRAAASAMDTGVASQQKLPADAVGTAPVAGSKAGGGGRKHLSSIANHVLRQCSLCVRCSSSLFRFVDFVTVFGGSCVLYKVDHIQQVHKFRLDLVEVELWKQRPCQLQVQSLLSFSCYYVKINLVCIYICFV